jgi:hypothetical protein
MPFDGIVNEGAELCGIRHDHLKLQLPPGAPAANV